MRKSRATTDGRLDTFLASMLDESRSQSANLIKNGFVSVNGKICTKSSFSIKIDDEIVALLPKTEPQICKSEVKFDVKILYEDEEILVLNKPSGLVVHDAPSVKEPTLVDWLKDRAFMLSTLSGEIRPGIVHRLDKGTSGAIIVAKTNKAHVALSEQLKDKSMGRIYLAITDLALKEHCIVDKPIARNPSNRLKNGVVSGGKEAKTAFLNLLNSDTTNLIAAKLFTGRTHQIRVHLASMNRHILGDTLYGFKSKFDKIARIMLHAYLLYFTHPLSGKKMVIKAEILGDFREILERKFTKENIDETITADNLWSNFILCDEWLCYRI